MSEIGGELARTIETFDQPTLTLIHQTHAPVVVAVLNSCFSREIRLVGTARLHTMVEQMLAEISTSGRDVTIPTGTGREVCMKWMKAQWLIRSATEDGSEVYSLTSHAQQAIDFMANLRQERTGLSEHRVANIIATARRINRESNPDRNARVAILEAEYVEIGVELDRLRAGGEIKRMSDDRLLEGFAELLSLVAQLPSDFKRVEESFRAVRSEILEDFRAERRAPGDVIDRYLDRIDNLVTATAEGRAFEGAFALLRDDALLQQLRADVNVLIEQGELFLVDRDRTDLRGIVPLMRAGLDSAMDQRSRITEVLRTYITSRDPGQDQEFDALLRELEGAVAKWLGVAGARATVPMELLPGKPEIETLKERYYDPSDDRPLPEFEVVDGESPEAMSLNELRRFGGPHLEQLGEALFSAEGRIDEWTLSGVFSTLPADARRPVDMLGLFHLATNSDGLIKIDDEELYSTVRPDGTRATFMAPLYVPGEQQAEDEP
ncbi:hypothetical protein GCM10009860_21980 [Microbacterium mitrae]|uniref:DUF3375 domain-containing protein n=1 Tax=Microbacterium mitrae TaxID=664640 RepID=A0A5C8HP41_9MICO|nr:DUF3375 domain-containing protein [Microbacterium mitrae]TXK04113.1 DUF3375 domain-containing protein [Microbacterium mitrae]